MQKPCWSHDCHRAVPATRDTAGNYSRPSVCDFWDKWQNAAEIPVTERLQSCNIGTLALPPPPALRWIVMNCAMDCCAWQHTNNQGGYLFISGSIWSHWKSKSVLASEVDLVLTIYFDISVTNLPLFVSAEAKECKKKSDLQNSINVYFLWFIWLFYLYNIEKCILWIGLVNINLIFYFWM